MGTDTTLQTLPDHFSFTLSDPDSTGLTIVALHDNRTGFVVRTALASNDRQVPAIMAFAGARFSRSALTAEELFAEIQGSKSSAQKKLANIFVNYGHASVGDMAMLFAYVENIPRYLMMQFFYASAIGSGQERSSRYQDFSTTQPMPQDCLFPANFPEKEKDRLMAQHNVFFGRLLNHYNEYLPQVTKAYEEFYQPDSNNPQHAGALQARVFDTVRFFLPAATRTSGAYITSSREWARLIQYLRSDVSSEAQYLGEQLQMLFAPPVEVRKELGYLPEAPDLIRHTEPDPRTRDLLQKLAKEFPEVAKSQAVKRVKAKRHTQNVSTVSNLTPTQTYLFLALQCLNPQLQQDQFHEWYNSLTPKHEKKLSGILLSDFTHHNHLPLWSKNGGYTFELTMTLGEAIDFNRHRAWGRFTPFLESNTSADLIQDGYLLPLYLEKVSTFAPLRSSFQDALHQYYADLATFAKTVSAEISPHFLLGLLPNAHRVRYTMSGGPKELSYMTQLRVRPGGHINYRMMAYLLAKEAAKQDPLLSALSLSKDREPHPASRDEFFDRS